FLYQAAYCGIVVGGTMSNSGVVATDGGYASLFVTNLVNDTAGIIKADNGREVAIDGPSGSSFVNRGLVLCTGNSSFFINRCCGGMLDFDNDGILQVDANCNVEIDGALPH